MTNVNLRAGASVTSAAFEVGYESLSQFSREYARKFGVPPSGDMRDPRREEPARAARPGRSMRRAREARR